MERNVLKSVLCEIPGNFEIAASRPPNYINIICMLYTNLYLQCIFNSCVRNSIVLVRFVTIFYKTGNDVNKICFTKYKKVCLDSKFEKSAIHQICFVS